jgi:hypothetical protein
MVEKDPTTADLVAMLWRPAEMWFTNKELLALRELIQRAEARAPRPRGYAYLASPHSHQDPQVVQERFKTTETVLAFLLRKGIWVYSPIVHNHALAQLHNLPTDAAYWQNYNHAMIDGAKELIVLRIAGWQDSKGVAEEIAYATSLGLPIHHFDMES